MRLRITSDGLTQHTHIVNAETGEELRGVTSVVVYTKVGMPTCKAIITLNNVALDMVANASVKKENKHGKT